MSEEDWKTADPDNDKTLTKDEYLASSRRRSSAPTRTTTGRSTRRN